MASRFQSLKVGVSTVALAAGSALWSAGALAQAGNEAAIETVVVTGSSIRGAAPIGSSLTTVTAADLQATGGVTVTEQMADVPALTGFGGSGRGTQGGNPGQGQEINIHQIGSNNQNSTLVLMDGHRLPTSGTGNTIVDPNNIPANMVQRVDVLAEGASATYGADAVAGVVNFITRKNFSGIQISEQTSWAGGLSPSKVIDALVGTSWPGGSAIVSYGYNFQGQLRNTDRPFTNPLNHPAQAAAAGLTGSGTTNFGNFNCPTATIQPNGAGNIYLNAQSATNVANTAANSPCSQWAYGSLLPDEKRQNAMLKISQTIGSNFSLTADIVFSEKNTNGITSSGVLTGFAMQTGAQANPFYVNPPGTSATRQQIRFDFNSLLGSGHALNSDEAIFGTVDADYTINEDWDIDALVVNGQDTTLVSTVGTANQGLAFLALNGTNQSSASTTTTSLPGYNLSITNLPLTTANALDVWSPAGSNRTSAAVLQSLTDNSSYTQAVEALSQARMIVNGRLFNLPAGGIKVAVGGEMLNTSLDLFTVAPDSVAAASVASRATMYQKHRTDFAEFGELQIPLVDEGMNVPLIQTLSLALALRHDDYSDFGATTNYKAAATWQVFDDLSVRGNLSTSFVAPSLTNIDPSQITISSTTNSVNVPVSQYPSITQFGIAGCTASSATCSISSLQGVSISSGGGPNVQAMRGHGWNIGTDYKPSFLPGARVSATFWDVAFLGGITNPTLQTRLNNQSLNYSVSFYPGCASAAQTSALQTNAVISTVLPSCIQYSVLSANTNYTSFWAQGLDANVGYTMDTDIGTFSTDENLTLATKFDQGFAYHSAPAPDQIFSSLNSEGSNTTFPNVALQMRGHLGWADDGLVADVYVNYTGAYRNIASPVNPIALTSSGVYSGVGGDHVNANLTMDLHFGYTFTSDVLVSSENRISFTIKNALGSAPPYFNSSTGYDPYVANIVGRTYTLSLSEKF